MATNSLQSLNCHHQFPLRRQSIDYPPIPSPFSSSSSLFFKPSNINPNSVTQTITFALSSSTTSSSSPTTHSNSQSIISFDLLRQHLSSNNFREADEETRRLLIVLAGEAAQKRGYVFFSEAKFISEADLKTIDELWGHHSNNKFGYSAQKKIWNKVNRDFTKFFIKVGWMKKLDTPEVEQYNYRSFPNEFIWELNEDTPVGHLPLTNALRGTQLLNSILTHPAFDLAGEEEQEEEIGDEESSGTKSNRILPNPLSKIEEFKPDYSF